MAKLPIHIGDLATIAAIYAAHEKKQEQRLSRRLGASVLGKACDRAIWYGFRWAYQEKFDGRMLRLFETGHLAEERFAAELRSIGCEVHLHDEAGNQFEYTAVCGHFVCKIDGMVLGLPDAPKSWHVCEFKTHNAKSFGSLQTSGLKAAKPEHYVQLMIGMHLVGVDRGLYLASNKDTDELYGERIKLDKKEAAGLMKKASDIIAATSPPPRLHESAEQFPCKFCTYREVCHGTTPPDPGVKACVNCRTCCHATPVVQSDLGLWRCEKHNKTLSEAEQKRACEDHLFIPDFITFAEVADAGDDWIRYRNADGKEWVAANDPDGEAYRSVELTVLPSPLVGAGEVEMVKKELGGTVVSHYPEV